MWLSDQLSDNSKGIESFIQGVFTNNTIIQFWKDELLVSVLLSDYSETFFKFFENEIVANEFKILKEFYSYYESHVQIFLQLKALIL